MSQRRSCSGTFYGNEAIELSKANDACGKGSGSADEDAYFGETGANKQQLGLHISSIKDQVHVLPAG
jgi:hypothetical protein